MATYPAPREILAQFNLSDYVSQAAALTQSQAALTYLPLAGGTETGNVLFSVGLQSNAPILSSDGTAALPSYTFNGDLDTGIYHPSANNLGLAAAGSQIVNISATGLRIPLATNQLALGSTFTSTLNSAASANRVLTLPDSTDTLVGAASTQSLSNKVFLAANGSLAAPSLSFVNDTGSGFYRSSAAVINYGISGGIVFSSTPTSFAFGSGVTVGLQGTLQLAAGDATQPGLNWGLSPSSGLYRQSGTDFRFCIASSDIQQWTSTGITLYKPVSNAYQNHILLTAGSTLMHISDTTTTDVTSPTTVVRSSGCTSAAGVVTVPSAGVYLVTVSLCWVGNAVGSRISYVIVNNQNTGSDPRYCYSYSAGTTAAYQASTQSSMINLAANDNVRAQVYQSSGGTLDLGDSIYNTIISVTQLF